MGGYADYTVKNLRNILNSGWHHLVISYAGTISDASLYVDGKKYLADTSGNHVNQYNTPDTKLRIGEWVYSANGNVAGGMAYSSLSDVRVYNRALSSNEVASLYALEAGPTNPQTITFPAIPTLTLTNTSYNLGATASSGLPVTYTIGNSSIAGITNGSLIPLGIGTTTIVASQAGDTNWMPAAPVTNPLVVTYAPQSYTAPTISNQIYGSLPFGITLPTNSSGLPVTARVVSGPATLNGTNLTITGLGTVTLAYDAVGNAVYGSNSVTNTFTVGNCPTNRKSQTITFGTIAARIYGGTPFTLGATASSSLPVTYVSSNTNVASFSGSTLTIRGAGTSLITAYQPGNGTWNPAPPVSQTLIVNKSGQTITFSALPKKPYGSAPLTLTARASSGLPISYSSSDSTVASLSTNGSNTILTAAGAGTATITATQPGNANFLSKSFALPITITPGNDAVTFSTNAPVTYATNLSIPLQAVTKSGRAVTYSSSASNVVSISGSNAIVQGAGSAVITASVGTNSLWNGATNKISLTVKKASQTITTSIPSSVNYSLGGVIQLVGSSSTDLPIQWSGGTAKVLSVSGTNAVILGKGTTSVIATQAGNANYNAATPVTNQLTIK